jgi:hypothetical protein
VVEWIQEIWNAAILAGQYTHPWMSKANVTGPAQQEGRFF